MAKSVDTSLLALHQLPRANVLSTPELEKFQAKDRNTTWLIIVVSIGEDENFSRRTFSRLNQDPWKSKSRMGGPLIMIFGLVILRDWLQENSIFKDHNAVDPSTFFGCGCVI